MIGRAARAAGFVVRCAALQAAWCAALGGAGLAAQQGCAFIEGSGNLSTVDMGGGPITYVTTPNLSCRDGVRIRADSAVSYQAANYVELIGRVRFEDAGQRLNANRAEYFISAGRLQAHGAVQVEQKDDGGVITGDEMIYLRAGPDRVRDQLDVFGGIAGGRSHARLFVRRRGAPAADTLPTDTDPVPDSSSVPYEVDADRILIEGDSYFRAMGRVEIQRETMQAFGDSVEYDQVGGTLRIAERARMIMDGRELSAEVIQARLPGEVVSEVIARDEAVLTADDVRLEAPLIHAFFEAGLMARLVAIPIPPPAPGDLAALPLSDEEPDERDEPEPEQRSDEEIVRPVASARSFTIVADSIDVLTPAEVLERIHAAGTARAESAARDSLNTPRTPFIARTDWMEGDTIVATFVRVDSAQAVAEGADSAQYRLERLIATRSARSLYRMVGDSARACGAEPLIHYVVGDRIVIEMDNGEIDSMHVTGQTQGVHAEPAACVPADSAAADSAAADSATGPVAARDPRLPIPRPPTLARALLPDEVARPELALRARARRSGGRR